MDGVFLPRKLTKKDGLTGIKTRVVPVQEVLDVPVGLVLQLAVTGQDFQQVLLLLVLAGFLPHHHHHQLMTKRIVGDPGILPRLELMQNIPVLPTSLLVDL